MRKQFLFFIFVFLFSAPVFAVNLVIYGTVADPLFTSKTETTTEDLNFPVPCCTVFVKIRTTLTMSRYFAKTSKTGFFSVTVNVPENDSGEYMFFFNGNMNYKSVLPVLVKISSKKLPDTLVQNLQTITNTPIIIDETLPQTIPPEIIADWEEQDMITVNTGYPDSIIFRIIDCLPPHYQLDYYERTRKIESNKARYLLACHLRRITRIKPQASEVKLLIFAKHHNFGGFLVGYHDNSNSKYSDVDWQDSSALCILKMKNYYSKHEHIYKNNNGVIRDPCISFNGKKVVFAMSGKKGSGYKIYEMEIDDPDNLRQLTFDPDLDATVADYEPCYLPNEDICFNSTRCFGMVDCGWNATSNLYLMDKNGRYMRRVGFDQASTFYPVIMDDGKVLYTRWEYNDRNVTSCMGLFVMNPDGTKQTEWFGNQTDWPMTIIHGRPIPNTNKVIAVAGGHHAPYSGELMIIDRTLGCNGTKPVQMIAPKRETKARVTKEDITAGNVEFLFQNPLPLDENNFLVSWRAQEADSIFRLYFMDMEGKRELIAWDNQSLSQPVLLKSRYIPPFAKSSVDYSKSHAEFSVQNVYLGAGLKGIVKGTAKKLRVIALNYRIQNGIIGQTTKNGDSKQAFVSCPVSKFGASWESKTVLGETPVFEDGSASFMVPDRTPVYFQIIDSSGYCIATMRSWSTLMPGEHFACVGCHENKNDGATPLQVTLAGQPKVLEKNLGIENNYFDYRNIIQPILNRHCIDCHKENHESGIDLRGDLIWAEDVSEAEYKESKKYWTRSYLSLMKGTGGLHDSGGIVNYFTIYSSARQQAAYSNGSSESILMTKIINGSHHDISLTSKEKNLVACWIDLCCPHSGYYNNYMQTEDSISYANLLSVRQKWEIIESKNIDSLIAATIVKADNNAFHNHTTPVSVSCTNQGGIRFFPDKRTLIFDKPVRSNIIICDLRGRVIIQTMGTGSNHDFITSARIPATVGRGIYVVRFKDQNGFRQKLITIAE